jgi:hypothetical protein
VAANRDPDSERAIESVEGLCKTVVATSGILLALLWGLTQRDVSGLVLCTIRIASIILAVSIIGSLLGLQFIVTQLQRNVAEVTKHPTVAYSYLLSWTTFIAGCFLIIVAIFQVR